MLSYTTGLLAVSIALLHTAAVANTGQQSTETIVVTGTRTPKHLYSSPVKVDIVDQVTIERLSRGTLKQLLEVMPGVVVSRNRKEGYTIQLQGFSADRVLVLMDGQPLIAPTGSAVDIDQISVNNIKQIEIVRGAASVLYGSSAMGGVINIITYTPENGAVSATAELHSYVNNAIDGEAWGQLYRLQASQKIGEWQSSVNFQYIDDPGFDYDPDTLLQNGVSNEKQFIHADLQREFDALTLITKTRWFNESRAKTLSLIPGQSSVLTYLSDVKQWQQDIKLAQQHDWYISGRFLGHNETSGNSNGLRDTQIAMQEVDAQYVWMGKYEWIVGTTLHQDQLDQVNTSTNTIEVNDANRQSAETYAQVNATVANTQVLLGSRIQYDSDFNWHHAWRGSASYTPDLEGNNWQLRVGLGQSYRVPNLKERYYIFDHSNLGYLIVGNAQLTPETATNATTGVQWRTDQLVNWQFTADLNFHYTDAENFITTVASAERSANAGLTVFVYENIAQALIQGADFSINAQSDNLQLQFNYHYLDAKDGNGNRLSERPRHMVKVSGTYHFEALNADLQIYAVGADNEVPDDSYIGTYRDHSFTINAQYAHQINAHWRWQLGVENLFDQHQSTQHTQQGLFDAQGLTSRKIIVSGTYQF